MKCSIRNSNEDMLNGGGLHRTRWNWNMYWGILDGGLIDRWGKFDGNRTGLATGFCVRIILHHHIPLFDDIDIVHICRCVDC